MKILFIFPILLWRANCFLLVSFMSLDHSSPLTAVAFLPALPHSYPALRCLNYRQKTHFIGRGDSYHLFGCGFNNFHAFTDKRRVIKSIPMVCTSFETRKKTCMFAFQKYFSFGYSLPSHSFEELP